MVVPLDVGVAFDHGLRHSWLSAHQCTQRKQLTVVWSPGKRQTPCPLALFGLTAQPFPDPLTVS
jgi:hypothetical protein